MIYAVSPKRPKIFPPESEKWRSAAEASGERRQSETEDELKPKPIDEKQPQPRLADTTTTGHGRARRAATFPVSQEGTIDSTESRRGRRESLGRGKLRGLPAKTGTSLFRRRHLITGGSSIGSGRCEFFRSKTKKKPLCRRRKSYSLSADGSKCSGKARL